MVTEFKIIDDITIRTNDRIAVFGKTGSGKTFFAKNWLLPHYTHYVFWDVKHENNDVQNDIILNTPEQLRRQISDYRKILYQPKSPRPSDFDEVCRIIFQHKNTSLYVDESSAVSTPGRILYWHNVIMTQGRSYNVGIINASQRPRAIHNTLISESEHLFIFTLNLETDIVKLRQQIGDAADDIRFLPEYHFIYHTTKFNKSFIFKPIKMFDPEKTVSEKLETYTPNLDEYLEIVR